VQHTLGVFATALDAARAYDAAALRLYGRDAESMLNFPSANYPDVSSCAMCRFLHAFLDLWSQSQTHGPSYWLMVPVMDLWSQSSTRAPSRQLMVPVIDSWSQSLTVQTAALCLWGLRLSH